MGWLWWNDDLDAAWHIPNVTEPGSRNKDGVTLQVNHPGPGAWPTSTKMAARRLEPFKNSWTADRTMTAASFLPSIP